MDINIVPFGDKYKKAVAELMDSFRDYLITIDPNGRYRRLPGYGAFALGEELENTKDDRGIIYIALDGEKPIGFGVAFMLKDFSEGELLGIFPTRRGRIEELYLAPEYRGKGIASMFIKKMEEFLKEKGCEYIFIGVNTFNENAHEIYKHLGYADVGVDLMKKVQ